jgi:hypothetical protein
MPAEPTSRARVYHARTTWPALVIAVAVLVVFTAYGDITGGPGPRINFAPNIHDITVGIAGLAGYYVGSSFGFTIVLWAVMYWTYVNPRNPRAGLPYFLVLMAVSVALFVVACLVLWIPRQAQQGIGTGYYSANVQHASA